MEMGEQISLYIEKSSHMTGGSPILKVAEDRRYCIRNSVMHILVYVRLALLLLLLVH